MSSILKEAPITPAREIQTMRNQIRRFFDEPFGVEMGLAPLTERRGMPMLWSPAVEASELPAEYVVTAELPGISPESIEISMDGEVLTLRGSKREERKTEDESRTYHLWEREYGNFVRTFRFPEKVDENKVSADFANGVLTVRVPKLEAKKQAPRTIPIAKK